MQKSYRPVLIWLWVCTTMVFAMVLLGGAVRLTGSGLSMTDWKPILGILPPLGQNAWQVAFEQYKQFPEYQLVNQHIDLGQFQFIYLMEYFHRLLGRLIGIVFFLPFLYFLVTRNLTLALKSRLWLLLFLGGCQGLLGWYMVKSGLIDNPHVSQYRLTAHLMLAVFIYAFLIHLICQLSHWQTANRSHQGYALAIVTLIFIMIASGGFVAGTKAGFILNTWPRIGPDWIPNPLMPISPWWKNLFENAVTIQLIHRWLAILVALGVISLSLIILKYQTNPTTRRIAHLGILMVLVQITLGITTLINHVPPTLGVAHQGGALILLGLIVALWTAQRPTTLTSGSL